MRNLWVSSLAWTVLASVAVGQQPFDTIDVAWPNTSGAGTPVLSARVHYPSVWPTVTPAIQPTTNGHPVLVFLHGYGLMGNAYSRLGDALAAHGYVTVMLNTAQYSYADMEADTRAVYDAIAVANAEPGGFFEGALRVDRVGLIGHSMGGAVIAFVLNEDPSSPLVNPGYLCGLGLAPVDPGIAGGATNVLAPMGLVSGQGDTLTPPALHATPFYNSLATAEGLRFHYEMGLGCTHMNMVGLTTNNPAVFDRTTGIAAGFFGQFLTGSLIGLEDALGPDAQNDPNLANLVMDAAVPQSWATGELTIGTTTRISVAAENGFAGLMAASSIVPPIPTPFGTLLLDPNTLFSAYDTFITGERLDFLLTVPNTLDLVGYTFAMQGVGATVTNVFEFGSAIEFVVTN